MLKIALLPCYCLFHFNHTFCHPCIPCIMVLIQSQIWVNPAVSHTISAIREADAIIIWGSNHYTSQEYSQIIHLLSKKHATQLTNWEDWIPILTQQGQKSKFSLEKWVRTQDGKPHNQVSKQAVPEGVTILQTSTLAPARLATQTIDISLVTTGNTQGIPRCKSLEGYLQVPWLQQIGW